MNKTQKRILGFCTGITLLAFVIYIALQPAMAQGLKVYSSKNSFQWVRPKQDKEKKTIFIVAGNGGTEIFDFMAPFYLFNATEKANVFVISEKKTPILLINSLFILPHYSFQEIDSLQMKADVIVVPNFNIDINIPSNPSTVSWIKKQYTGENTILAICDGSATVAATGLYDGKLITTHSGDWDKLRKLYPKGNWVKGVSYTKSGNLYSTAGVANAPEGCLAVIEELFGKQVMEKVMADVHYPFAEIKRKHQNSTVNTFGVITMLKKVIFKHDREVGVLLQDRINEFDLAAILDTYSRTFPAFLNTFVLNGSSITSKFGLTLFPTGKLPLKTLDELHLLKPEAFAGKAITTLPYRELVKYGEEPTMKYTFDICLERIERLYGLNFKEVIKISLDYQ